MAKLQEPSAHPRIEWVDRETLRVIDGDRTALVWVDVEAGFFSRGRTVHADSIKYWKGAQPGADAVINAADKEMIINAIKSYYAGQRTPCRVEP